MFSQNHIEVIKLLASIATLVAIALIGLLINRSIQRQNAIAERQSSWLTKWADDFLKTASGFNDTATTFFMLFLSTQWKAENNLHGSSEEQKSMQTEVVTLMLALQRWRWDMPKYSAFAPSSGEALEKAAQSFFDEANSWIKNKGGGVESFQQKQLTFNVNARNVHAELLGLKVSK